MGPPIVSDGQYGTPCDIWVGWGKISLIFYFRWWLPDIIYNQRCYHSSYGKRGGFRGMSCCLGGLMGPPLAPDG